MFQQRTVKRVLQALAGTTAGQAILGLRSRRLDSLAELREHLGRLDTILCLGNGPSSEDARLREVAYDCLFRVNWRWLDRGFLIRPDVVFTGDRVSLRRCPGGLFGFRSVAEETSMRCHAFLDPRVAPFSFFTTERLGLALNEQPWGTRPTNGAVMLTTAVALRPRRLIVAGLDLFSHPAGKYPGDAVSANRYAAVHSVRVERAILRQALQSYRGELVILSSALEQVLALSAAIRAS